jgi:hypothetical protein
MGSSDSENSSKSDDSSEEEKKKVFNVFDKDYYRFEKHGKVIIRIHKNDDQRFIYAKEKKSKIKMQIIEYSGKLKLK